MSEGGTDWQADAESLVRANRFTIAVVFPVVGAVGLVASAQGFVPDPLAFNPYLVLFGTLVMRLPLLVGVAPLLNRRAIAALLGLTAYAYAIELVGVTTGWPYGQFEYGVELGPMVAGVPLGLPVFFLPLVVNGYLLSLLLLGRRGGRVTRLGFALALVLAVDLALDPAAVAIGFWRYLDGGVYYGVPLSNYAGWVLSGTVGVLAVEAAFAGQPLDERLDDCEFTLDDLVSFVLLWGSVNVFYANWLAVAAVGVLLAGLVRSERFDLAVGRPSLGL